MGNEKGSCKCHPTQCQEVVNGTCGASYGSMIDNSFYLPLVWAISFCDANDKCNDVKS